MINLSNNYKVEPKIKKGDQTGLDNYGVSSFPGTSKIYHASFDGRKFITGLDINSRDVLLIKDEKLRKKKQDEITQLKSEIESYLAQPGILDPTSEYWDSFSVIINTGQDLKTTIEIDGKSFSLEPNNNPMHRLALIMLDANGFLPKSKVEASDPVFKDAKFFLTTQDEEDKDSEAYVNREIAVGKYLSLLFGDKVNYQRAFEIAYFLGLKPKNGMSEAALKKNLYLATKDRNFAEQFISACEMENDEIAIANLFKKGVALDVIKYNGSEKLYYRGGVNYRSTERESIEFLKNPNTSMELAQLKEAVEKKAAKSKNLA